MEQQDIPYEQRRNINSATGALQTRMVTRT